MASKKSSKKIEATKSSDLSIKLKISKDKAQSKSKIIITVQLLSGEEVIATDSDFVIL